MNILDPLARDIPLVSDRDGKAIIVASNTRAFHKAVKDAREAVRHPLPAIPRPQLALPPRPRPRAVKAAKSPAPPLAVADPPLAVAAPLLTVASPSEEDEDEDEAPAEERDDSNHSPPRKRFRTQSPPPRKTLKLPLSSHPRVSSRVSSSEFHIFSKSPAMSHTSTSPALPRAEAGSSQPRFYPAPIQDLQQERAELRTTLFHLQHLLGREVDNDALTIDQLRAQVNLLQRMMFSTQH